MFNRLYDFKVAEFQPMRGPVGLAYAIREIYDETRQIKISIEEYEEQDDNNDRGN